MKKKKTMMTRNGESRKANSGSQLRRSFFMIQWELAPDLADVIKVYSKDTKRG